MGYVEDPQELRCKGNKEQRHRAGTLTQTTLVSNPQSIEARSTPPAHFANMASMRLVSFLKGISLVHVLRTCGCRHASLPPSFTQHNVHCPPKVDHKSKECCQLAALRARQLHPACRRACQQRSSSSLSQQLCASCHPASAVSTSPRAGSHFQHPGARPQGTAPTHTTKQPLQSSGAGRAALMGIGAAAHQPRTPRCPERRAPSTVLELSIPTLTRRQPPALRAADHGMAVKPGALPHKTGLT